MSSPSEQQTKESSHAGYSESKSNGTSYPSIFDLYDTLVPDSHQPDSSFECFRQKAVHEGDNKAMAHAIRHSAKRLRAVIDAQEFAGLYGLTLPTDYRGLTAEEWSFYDANTEVFHKFTVYESSESVSDYIPVWHSAAYLVVRACFAADKFLPPAIQVDKGFYVPSYFEFMLEEEVKRINEYRRLSSESENTEDFRDDVEPHVVID
ncbi:hypothetical protein BJ508DRAFT_326400 [Ascobolus immersus RN42]|uniref:Uncharacterized protein n=1 Tax=Ascobolus immersus RN42 TaxID=1160509 RepID=A0A3N4I7Q1_ASCIM|nr:hypothetical protein BJ508DRAFT_326400 [Ascobolus immersus RN42]